MNSNVIIDHRNTQRCHDPNVHSCFCPLAQTSSTADQISGYLSIPLPCLLCQALNVLLFSPKVKLDGVHASIFFTGVSELSSSGTSASADTIRCTVYVERQSLMSEHQMSKSSYLYWTQSFFGLEFLLFYLLFTVLINLQLMQSLCPCSMFYTALHRTY